MTMKNNLTFYGIQQQYNVIRKNVKRRISIVLEHGQFIHGPEVTELESNLAKFCGSEFCISCASGTDALFLSLKALGIGRGHAVFTTPFSFFATSEAILNTGATPIFVDIDHCTFNMSPRTLLESIKNFMNSDLPLIAKAILPVDIFGLPANYPEINSIAKYHGNLAVIADAAQSFGASIFDTKSGALASHASCTSFFPTKPLGCYGDGGAVFTNDPILAKNVRQLASHGAPQFSKYDNSKIGTNSRLDTIQAAILLEKLEIFNDELKAKQSTLNYYRKKLPKFIIPQLIPNNYSSALATLSVTSPIPNSVVSDFQSPQNFLHNIYYPKPIPCLDALTGASPKTPIPFTENLCNHIFSLPLHPYLSNLHVNKICAFLETQQKVFKNQ
jgi:dTDP-4-amino-4,6-dideoxygalactose transaminase